MSSLLVLEAMYDTVRIGNETAAIASLTEQLGGALYGVDPSLGSTIP